MSLTLSVLRHAFTLYRALCSLYAKCTWKYLQATMPMLCHNNVQCLHACMLLATLDSVPVYS